MNAFAGTNRGDVTASATDVVDYDPIFALELAFREWSREGDIDFVRVEDDGSPLSLGLNSDIRIAFG
ncbi:MAG: hypothetical protein AAF401_06080 [Pseudomonadota bacterium]